MVERSVTLSRLEKLDSFYQDCLELFTDMSVDSLLRRIIQIAASWTNACYCVAGLVGSRRGAFSQYQIYGLTPIELDMVTGKNGEKVYSIPTRETLVTALPMECKKYRVFEGNYPNITSLLHVPIYGDDEVIGTITVLNKIGAFNFSEDDASLLEKLSVYSGVAISNAKMRSRAAARETQLKKRNEDISLMNELGRIFTDTDGNIGNMLEEMLATLVPRLDLKIGEFFLNSEEEKDIYVLTASYVEKDTPVAGSILGLEEVEKGGGLLGDVAQSVAPYRFTDEELEIVNGKRALRTALNYMAVLPVVTSEGTIGLLLLGGRMVQGQDEPDMDLLSSIAGRIAPLVENLRLINQRQKVAILEERERIGMDLHDGVIQSIYGVGLTLENARLTAIENPEFAAEKIKVSIEALNSTIRDIRAYIMGLKPDKLTHENLLQSMRRLTNDFYSQSFVPADFKAKVEHIEALSDERTNVFYMICKEALSNILKHAHASHVNVTFSEMKDRFVLMVQDDGEGFDTSQPEPEGHHGVTNMVVRAKNAGGSMEMISIPGKGTTIIAWLPMR